MDKKINTGMLKLRLRNLVVGALLVGAGQAAQFGQEAGQVSRDLVERAGQHTEEEEARVQALKKGENGREAA